MLRTSKPTPAMSRSASSAATARLGICFITAARVVAPAGPSPAAAILSQEGDPRARPGGVVGGWPAYVDSAPEARNAS